MKLISSLCAAAALYCAGAMMVDPAVAQQDASAQQKQKGAASVAPTNEFTQQSFVPGNFRLQLEAEGAVDGVEEEQSATDDIGEARDYAIVPAPAAAPPTMTSTGGGQRPPPRSESERLGLNYTMFPTDGAPVRATTNLDLSEAGAAKQKQRAPENDDDENDENDTND